jgi:hypothetical protein
MACLEATAARGGVRPKKQRMHDKKRAAFTEP